MKQQKSYNYGIGFLKAISIMGIVLYHIFPSIINGGFLGVCIFFIISGYLTAKQTDSGWERDTFSVRKYYIKKAIRIYPQMYIMVMSIIAFFTLFHKELLLGAREETASILCGVNNWWQIATRSSYFLQITEHSPFTHLWYMGVEMQLLLIWPLLYLFYRKVLRKHLGKYADLFFALLVLASGLLMGVFYSDKNVNRVYYGTDTRAFAFFMGVVLGLREHDWREKLGNRLRNKNGKLLFLLMLLVTLALFVLVNGEPAWLYRGGMFAISVFFTLMIFVMNSSGFSEMSVLKKKPVQWLGKHSYGIYLWHYPLLFIIMYLY